MTLIEKRNAEFIRQFRQAVERRRVMDGLGAVDLQEVVRETLKGHPESHFKEFSTAYEVVRGILSRRRRNGTTSENCMTLRTLYWQELADQVEQEQKKGATTLAGALDRVLLRCHPSSFFMTEDYALRLVRPLVRVRRMSKILI